MKILYAVQGTGNGHVSRAREIIPLLQEYGELDVLISGTQADLDFPVLPKYKLSGLGFVFGKSGGIDFKKTWKDFHLFNFLKDIRNLPVTDYDVVIHDFEPVAAWACRLRRKKCLTLSHQSSYFSPNVPKLKGFHWGRIILNHYAPADQYIGFHFKNYDDHIYTPVIRSEVRKLNPSCGGHYTVYLPAYGDEFITSLLKKYPNIKWEVFSKKAQKIHIEDHIKIWPVNNDAFLSSLESCTGLLTGGGFEGPSEALFLYKKLLVVPMKNQYEQQCNALALEKMGVPVVWNENQFSEKLNALLYDSQKIRVNYPDQTREIIERLLKNNGF